LFRHHQCSVVSIISPHVGHQVADLPTEFNTFFIRHAGKLGELSQHIGAFQRVRDFIPSLP
jgi:hypothetical protein